VGAATRLIEFTRFDKQYEAVCLLGRETDSADVTGVVLRERPWQGLDPDEVRKVVLTLAEIREQIPPMVSAVKSGGKRLYQLAREGKEVERLPRPVRILALEILSLDLPRVSLRVTCSSGTYIRTLCGTLGERLEVGGCLEALRRTQVGPFSMQQAHSLEYLKKAGEEGRGESLLLPASDLVAHLPSLTLEADALKTLCQGQPQRAGAPPMERLRVLNGEGRLCAIVESTGDWLKPQKVFGPEGIA
jgi:tRNA pseudouridine55 synthase